LFRSLKLSSNNASIRAVEPFDRTISFVMHAYRMPIIKATLSQKRALCVIVNRPLCESYGSLTSVSSPLAASIVCSFSPCGLSIAVCGSSSQDIRRFFQTYELGERKAEPRPAAGFDVKPGVTGICTGHVAMQIGSRDTDADIRADAHAGSRNAAERCTARPKVIIDI